MATLRDLVPGYDPTLAAMVPGSGPSPVQQGIRGPATATIEDEAAAGGMGQLRRGFATGRLNTESNYLLAEESRLRGAGRLAEADELRPRIEALQGRAATFAPAEQDVTQLQWNPGRILDYGLGTMGQGAASMVDPVALGVGANAAAGVVGMVPHSMAQAASKGLRLAGLAGGYGLNALQGKGEFYGEATQNPEIMRTKSAQEIDTAGNVSGAVSGALDTVLTGSVAGRIAGRPTMKALAGLGGPAKFGLDVAGEAATETLQGEVKRGVLGHLDPTRDTSGDTAARWNDAAGGAFGAAPMSAVSHLASKGHERLAVPDDTSSDDVSGKVKAPGTAPRNEPLSKAVLRRAKEHDDGAAAEAWDEVLSGSHSPDLDTATTEQHAALMKELGGRAAKGDATAQQHLETLQAMDPEDPAGWYDEAPRKAAYDHIIGDGTDHEKVRAAYAGRKLNEQGQSDPHTALATGLLKAALPTDAQGLDAATVDLGRDLSKLAKAPKGRITPLGASKMWDTAGRMVELYGFEGAKATIAKVGMALGVEETPVFKALQSQLAGANFLQAKKNHRVSRVEAAKQLLALVPVAVRSKLFDEGVDLTAAPNQLGLLDTVEQTAKAIGWGAVDNKGQPIEVKPSAYANLTARLGGDAARAALDLVSPGKVEEREDVGTPKKNGGEKTDKAQESDKLDNGLSDDLEDDDWALDGALKNIDRAPGTSMYLFKGRKAVGSTDGAHPFVKNKGGNLPTLSRLDETNDGDGPKGSGPKTLEHMMGKAYEALGGGFKNIRRTITETVAGPLRPGEARRTRRTTTESDPMMELAPASKGALGVGSSRIRTVSAAEVMKHHGLAPEKRIELMREYLARPQKEDGKEKPPVLAKDDPTIRQIQVLDRAIKARALSTPKLTSTLQGNDDVGQTRVRLKKTDNPEYARLLELKGQRKEVFAALAAKLGVDVDEDASIADLADAYFGERFLVVAEQMAEKDGLRLSPAEVRKLIKRGADDLDYSDQFKKDGFQAQVQADMNLIRFKSAHAVSKDGVAAVRAGELVKWVFENRTTFTRKDRGSEVVRAHEFRDALMEGIGALAADGYMSELPFMVNEKGETESFEKGFPPSLKLSGLTQAALNVRREQRVAAAQPFVGPPDVEAVAREQDGGAKSPDAAVARDEARTERLPAESDGAPDEYRHQGVERGAADRRSTAPEAGAQSDLFPGGKATATGAFRSADAGKAAGTGVPDLAIHEPHGSAERFWDSPELTSTRTDENRVPSQAEPREQKKGVPTDRTELAQRNAVMDANVDEVRPLTVSNAMRKAEGVAEQLMAGLMRPMKPTWVDKTGKPVPAGSPLAHKLVTSENAAKADPVAGWERVKRMARAMASSKQYAAPLAYLLTPKNIDAMVQGAKNPATARPMLLRMQSAVADALTKMDEGGFTIADRTKLARLLTGNEKLPAPQANAALESLSWTERKAAKAERQAAEGAAPVTAKPEPTPAKPTADKQVAWVAKHLSTSVIAFREAIKDFTFEQLDKVRSAIIDLDDSEDHHGVEAARWSWALGHVESQMNEKEADTGTRLNEQATANAAHSDEAIAAARAYIAKVLGPKVKVEFSKDFTHTGEWVDAEQLIRLSTATGPGVLSVAYHEALHGFWSRAVKSHPGATEALSRVMSSPAMLERLKALLAEHPAALAAITEGPHAAEERVAYAYQFWAAGELEVDKPATTLFAKFRKFLRKVLGMVRESETALDLMTALHDGKLAEPSAAGEVIGKILKNATWNEDFKRKHDKFFQNAAAAISPSNDVLRHEKLSATAQRLGRAMFTNPGEEGDGKFKEGYLNARSRKIRQYTNYLYAALKGLSEKDMEAAAKYLQLKTAPEDIAYAPVRKAVTDVRALTRRYWEYATKDAGLKLEYLGDDHYPRVWSLNALIEEGGKDKFIAMLMKPKYAPTMAAALEMANDKRTTKLSKEEVAAEMYQHLIDKNGVDEKMPVGEGDDGVLTPFFASQKERSFKWLDDADVEPFLEKDLVGAMSRYLHQGIRAAEYARRFGEGGEKLKEMLAMKGDEWINPETDRRESRPDHGAIAAEIVASLKEQGVTGKKADVVLARHMEDIRRSVSAHEGSLGKDITPTARKWSSAAMAYQNLRLLPLSLFAAFGDVMGIVAHGAGAKAGYEAFLQGTKDVYLRWKDAASDMPAERQKSVWEGIAEMVGAIDSHMFLEQMGKAHTSEFMTDFARKSNRALFMANGLTAWDRSMRVSATKAAVLFLQDHAGLPDKQHSKRWLAELGLAAKDIPLDADGKLITDRHVLAATKSIPIEQATKEMERVHQALVRWVEGAVLTPNAGQRPTWASDPHYAVLFHLKQFTYSFHHTILKRAFNEASHGNMNPFGALAAAIPTMVAADMVKGLVLGGGSLPAYMKAWDAGDWILHGAERAGLGGVGQFGIDALSDPLGVMGPTVGQVGDFVTSPTEILHNIHNAIPGGRYIKGLPDFTRATA